MELLTSSVDDISSWSLCWQPLSSAAKLASIGGVGQCATVVGPAVVMGATELHHKHVLAWLLGDQVVRNGIGEYNLSWPPPGKRERRSEEGKGRREGKRRGRRRKGWRRREGKKERREGKDGEEEGEAGREREVKRSRQEGAGKQTFVLSCLCDSSEEHSLVSRLLPSFSATNPRLG